MKKQDFRIWKILKNNFLGTGIFIVIVVSLAFVFAGDVILKEGDMSLDELNVSNISIDASRGYPVMNVTGAFGNDGSSDTLIDLRDNFANDCDTDDYVIQTPSPSFSSGMTCKGVFRGVGGQFGTYMFAGTYQPYGTNSPVEFAPRATGQYFYFDDLRDGNHLTKMNSTSGDWDIIKGNLNITEGNLTIMKGNITLYSQDGTAWNCGVTNAGEFICKGF